MAENSLFAILLRSPWWVSLAIAAVLALLARLLLPADYAVVGMLGIGLPFVLIGALAARRQLRAPSRRQLEAALAQMRTLGGEPLVAAAAHAWQADGWQVARHAGAGADLVLERAGRCRLLSLRRWKAASTGVEPLRELQAACARRDGADGIYVHGGELSDKARDFARTHGLTLLPAAELAHKLAASGALRSGR